MAIADAVTLVGNVVEFDFGPNGIAGNPATADGDGHYRVSVDESGDGVPDRAFDFHRLFGDADGNKKVDADDTRLIATAIQSQDPNADVNGDGQVTVVDRALTQRQFNREITGDLEALRDHSTSEITNKAFHNFIRPNDVDGNHFVDPLDVLLIINVLNSRQPSGESDRGQASLPQVFLDTSQDGRVEPIDALLVINELNRQSDGIGEPSHAPPLLLPSDTDDERDDQEQLDAQSVDVLFALS